MNNERGGIISKMIFIPIGLTLMAGFFVLGYYVGKYQNRSGLSDDVLPPLPDIAAQHMPRQDEFTFYKTLADKESKTVTLEIKPKSQEKDLFPVKKGSGADGSKDRDVRTAMQNRSFEIKIEKPSSSSPPSQALPKQPLSTTVKTTGNSKIRYTLQIGSYQERETADSEVKKITKKGYAASVVTSELAGKGTWYRVRLGSFSSRAAAEKLQTELKAKEGIATFVSIE